MRDRWQKTVPWALRQQNDLHYPVVTMPSPLRDPIPSLRGGMLLLALLMVLPAGAQSLDLTVRDTGISIGDSEEVTGLRINFRDRAMQRVRGINATVWTPRERPGGKVNGVALGLPLTGAGALSGIGLGLLGISVDSSLTGMVLAGLGAGAGQDIRGVVVAGLGAGAGQDIRGIVFTGLGAGAGRDITGIAISGIGVGAGQHMTGVSLSGVAAGAGGTLRGIHVAGIGIGATNVRGIILSGFAAGGHDVYALSLAPGYFKIDHDGRQRGVSIAAFNRIRGVQEGLTIGIVNWTRQLEGIQIGLINGAGNKKRMRWMPFVNWN